MRLHVRGYGTRGRQRTPVVCLPGLARTTDDFDTLAEALANDPDRARHVLAIDYRGRGESEYDRDPANYNIATEVADLVAILTALEIEPAVFVGTSRGGILAMVLATVRPTAIAGVVLNDIGPVIETKGLVRIKSYLGHLPQPKGLDDAAEILRHLFATQFHEARSGRLDGVRKAHVQGAGWTAQASLRSEACRGARERRHGASGAPALEGVRRPRPGSGHGRARRQSDLLTAETVDAMRARRPDLVTLEVPDQGHAPLLAESDVIAEIAAFIDRC